MINFARLSAKERRALTIVEVEERSYRDAAQELGIRLENVKMVIFRGRRKIFRGMERSLAEIAMATAGVAPSRPVLMGQSSSKHGVLARRCNEHHRLRDQETSGV